MSREVDMSDVLARKVVRMLASHNVEPDIDIANAMVGQWAAEHGMDDDLEPGLISAGEKGWIVDGKRLGTIRLTQSGYRAARS